MGLAVRQFSAVSLLLLIMSAMFPCPILSYTLYSASKLSVQKAASDGQEEMAAGRGAAERVRLADRILSPFDPTSRLYDYYNLKVAFTGHSHQRKPEVILSVSFLSIIAVLPSW